MTSNKIINDFMAFQWVLHPIKYLIESGMRLSVIRKSNLFDDPKLELFFSFIVHVYRLLIELLMIVRGWQLSV